MTTQPGPFFSALAAAACLLPPLAAGQESPPSAPDASPRVEALADQQRVREAAEAQLEARLAMTAADLYGPEGLVIPAETPLDEALNRLTEPAGVDWRPDQTALDIDGIELEDAFVDPDFRTPTNAPVTLRTALELLLEGVGEELACRNRAGVLTVTTTREAELVLVTRTYDVRDLALRELSRAEAAGLIRAADDLGPDYHGPRPNCFGPARVQTYGELLSPAEVLEAMQTLVSDDAWEPVVQYDLQSLRNHLVATTGGQDNGGLWEEEGGLGTVEGFVSGVSGEGPAVLIIRQTEAVHRQISDLLADLRAVAGGESGGVAE